MSQAVKTRFAPSPTGLIHLGNLRTALFNWLYAHKSSGQFLLRIEDTDLERSRREFTEALKRDLQWMGLAWQEGPDIEGALGPYHQSERNEIYAEYFQRLEDLHVAYPCFCSAQELNVMRKVQQSSGQAPRYAGTCARLSLKEAEQKKNAGLAYTLRFRVPNAGQVEFTDLVRGAQRFECKDIGDFIIRRSDGTPAFFFTNAIDDALMNVSHVMRGEDHLTNTPRQKLILEALGLRVPVYGHISLIVGSDGTPLSKRHGSKSVNELREQGYLPIAVINYLARLGHNYTVDAYMTADELAQGFEFDHLGKAPARFQATQLIFWQHEALKKLSTEQLWAWMSKATIDDLTITTIVAADKQHAFAQTIRENVTLPEDALKWAANLFSTSGCFADSARAAIKSANSGFLPLTQQCAREASDFKSFVTEVGKQTNTKGKELYMPLRAALTGEVYATDWNSDWEQGPQLAAVWDLLGSELILRRLQVAQSCG